jgi:5-formyltetrahydrofolate cyclo-ligase
MAAETRRRKSLQVAENLWKLPEVSEAAMLFIYVNFRSEVETMGLIRQCLARGKKVAVPLTNVAESRLHPFLINDPRLDLRPGYCNIPEPMAEKLSAVEPGGIETIILPGSAFDEQGGRLGYGGGYYDRFLLNDAPLARRIGIAFEQQIVEQLPMLPHDQYLHILVTEKRIIRIS